jgi:chorismate dehydratase
MRRGTGPLRVGRVRYINCEPVYAGLERGLAPFPFRLVDGTPTELNERLRRGGLDVSVISALEYATRPERYRLLPDLAIACDGAVGSVLLLSHAPIEALEGRTVGLPASSMTSIYLLRLLCGERYRVRPAARLQAPDPEAVLLIGDEALRARAKGAYPHVLDLGEAWKAWTGLPFVFAVWAVREAVYQRRPAEVRTLHRALLASKAESRRDLARIADAVRGRVGMTRAACLAYLRDQLSFDLTPRHVRGLVSFLEALVTRGELRRVPPLRFID